MAEDSFKSDKSVVMVAVAAHGPAFQVASDELRDDPQVCLAAMASNIGCKMEHASTRLQEGGMLSYIRQQLQDHVNMLVFTRLTATEGAVEGPQELSMELIEQIAAFVDPPPRERLEDLCRVRDRLVEVIAAAGKADPPRKRLKTS